MATPHVLVYIVSIRHKQKGAKLARKLGNETFLKDTNLQPHFLFFSARTKTQTCRICSNEMRILTFTLFFMKCNDRLRIFLKKNLFEA